ncbi:hypothetical protein AGMMS49936_11810 [Endomicrobiia bacterium]|nr:hypothetical protein AGMMS49936_11810 [Endomicrobiia bacterium]
MEKLKQFTIKNNFSKTLEYYGKAKEYISKSVAELTKTMSKNKITEQGKAEYDGQEKVEYDEIAADKKYYEAERSWEFALRLNPDHKKAKVALKKLKENMSN